MSSGMPWFRFYNDTLGDRKLAYIAQETGRQKGIIMGLWSTILTIASSSPQRGVLLFTENKPITIQHLCFETDFDIELVAELIGAFLEMGLLSIDATGIYSVANWDKRQFTSDHSTERVRKHREAQSGNDGETETERSGNVSETDQIQITDTESEPEKDTETESEKPSSPSAKAAKPLVPELKRGEGHYTEGGLFIPPSPPANMREQQMNAMQKRREEKETSTRQKQPQRPTSALAPDTAEARRMFGKLQENARQRGQRGPQRFGTLEQKQCFLAAVARLDGRFDTALEAGLKAGIVSLPKMVAYLSSPKWQNPQRQQTRGSPTGKEEPAGFQGIRDWLEEKQVEVGNA